MPRVDAGGSDLGGVRDPDMLLPVATYSGRALRKPRCAEGELLLDPKGEKP